MHVIVVDCSRRSSCPLEISISHDRRPAMPRSGDVNHVQVVLVNDLIEVRVIKVCPGVVPQ